MGYSELDLELDAEFYLVPCAGTWLSRFHHHHEALIINLNARIAKGAAFFKFCASFAVMYSLVIKVVEALEIFHVSVSIPKKILQLLEKEE